MNLRADRKLAKAMRPHAAGERDRVPDGLFDLRATVRVDLPGYEEAVFVLASLERGASRVTATNEFRQVGMVEPLPQNDLGAAPLGGLQNSLFAGFSGAPALAVGR